MTTTTAYASFSRPCLDCGHTISIIGGVEQPHTCEAPEDQRQLVAQAYWQGHDAAAAISPEAFMAQPPDPEEELEHGPEAERDPLVSIAESLRHLVEHFAGQPAPDAPTYAKDEYIQVLREANGDLDAKAGELYALVEEIEALIKPSTSKLANTVRDAIEAWRNPQVPADEPQPDEPSPDAGVEAWRAFARGRGYTGADADTMNRSQIRSMLGIPQPGTPVAPTVVHS